MRVDEEQAEGQPARQRGSSVRDGMCSTRGRTGRRAVGLLAELVGKLTRAPSSSTSHEPSATSGGEGGASRKSAPNARSWTPPRAAKSAFGANVHRTTAPAARTVQTRARRSFAPATL